MSHTLVDAIVILTLILSTLFAWSRGLIRETFAILGWVLALVISARFAYALVPHIEGLPFIRDYVADSCELLTIVSFAVLFISTMVIIALITPFFSELIKNSPLGIFNSAVGGVYGFIRGVLLVLLFFLVYDNFIRPSAEVAAINDAMTYGIFAGPRQNLEDALPDQEAAPDWLTGQFNNVTRKCRGTAPNV